jgi:hypothetical protein
MIFQRMKLGLVDWNIPLTLYLDYDASIVQAILVQNRNSEVRPVAIINRKLLVTETKYNPLKLRIALTAWAIKYL